MCSETDGTLCDKPKAKQTGISEAQWHENGKPKRKLFFRGFMHTQKKDKTTNLRSRGRIKFTNEPWAG